MNAEDKADHVGRNGRAVVPSPDYQNIEVKVEGDIAVVTLASQTGRGNPSNGIGPELAEFFRLTMLDRRAFEGPYEDIRAILLRGKETGSAPAVTSMPCGYRQRPCPT